PLQDHGLADMRLVQLSASLRSAFHVTLAFVSTTTPLADVGSCSFWLVPIPPALPAVRESPPPIPPPTGAAYWLRDRSKNGIHPAANHRATAIPCGSAGA